ncbi:MAG: phenylalanine--tRNA ligase subunit beta [Desulfarculus sp.]|nr:phenylalanine--tRNA ligase subunit beta [Desulfarculus sp.]
MKISLEWLGQYVDLDGIEPQVIAHELTMKTAEVEELVCVQHCLQGVLVGQVLDLQPIAGSDKLTLAQVDLGGHVVQTVCGAPNLRLGLKAPFAPAGTLLAGGVKVARASLAGHDSQGVLCSAKELGLGEFHEVVMDLPADTSTGAALSSLAPERDYLIDIDNKSLTHRPDLWGHYGFARELAAIFGRELKPLGMADLKNFRDLPAFPLSVEDFELCPGYCCLELDSLAPAPSPLMMQWRLHSVGLRAINLLVDLTNFIMLEIGQPMHAFDADHLQAVRVATLGQDGQFTTLDGSERKMLASDLMIWNEKEPVALAGVMGGLRSEVTPATTRLLLESANFQPMTIRRTAVRLGLRTDASQRFEKDLPPAFMPLGIARFLHLVRQAGQDPAVRSRLTHAGTLGQGKRHISMPLGFVQAYMGEELPQERVESILKATGFGCRVQGQEMTVEVPTHRSARDISVPQDIVEEVARFYGYDNIAFRLPPVEITHYAFNDLLRAEHKLRRFLAQSKGYVEVHNYSWYDDRWLAKLGQDPGQTLTLANPVAPYKSRLRTTLMPNLLELIPQNYGQRDDLRLFEVGHVYQPHGAKGRKETSSLGAVAFQAGTAADLEPLFLEMKGLLEDACLLLGCGKLDLRPGRESTAAWAQAGCYLEIWHGQTLAGGLGYLSGPALNAFKRNAQVAWLELDLNALAVKAYPELQMTMPPVYPGSWLDFSILWPAAKGFAALERELAGFGDALLQGRDFVASYGGKGLEPGQKSYTFRCWIGLNDRTLTKEDIDGFKERFLAFLAGRSLAIR